MPCWPLRANTFRGQEDLVADIDEATGSLQIYSLKQVVEVSRGPVEGNHTPGREEDRPVTAVIVGAEIREPKPTEALGRISAQTAKQVILQKVREAERDSVFSEFQGRQGELVNCVMKRVERARITSSIWARRKRVCPRKEQSRIESFSVGDRVRCVIKGVERGGKNSGVVVSRELPVRTGYAPLFEQEVPEIYDNTVAIKGLRARSR